MIGLHLRGKGLYRSHRSFSVYVAGSAWTGALGLGHDAMIHPDTSEVSDDRENTFTELRYNPLNVASRSNSSSLEVLSAAAGWGHSAYIVSNQKADKVSTTLLVCGRPYDFQSLLRLKRLPSFLRRPLIQATLLFEDENHAGLRPLLTEISLPLGDMPINITETSNSGKVLAASAGTTAVIGQSGKLYMFGGNQRGQCGVNQPLTNHVWEPTSVVISHSEKILYEPKFMSVALGLQHGLAIDTEGALFSWGKGNRGQLGVRKVMSNTLRHSTNPTDQVTTADSKGNSNWFNSLDLTSCEYSAIRVNEFHLTDSVQGKDIVIPASDIRVTKISAGYNHSAAITDSNHAWIWGKNTKANSNTDSSILSNMPLDSQVPINIKGLPSNLLITDIACGSHHTSVLMEDGSVYAIGIATDTLEPLLDPALQIIPPGLIEQPVHQFTSHFDRTTIVHGKQGSVMEVHLWEDASNGGVFEPGWVKDFDSQHIKMVHHGWLHTIVVTNN